jgi:hypothetical protein
MGSMRAIAAPNQRGGPLDHLGDAFTQVGGPEDRLDPCRCSRPGEVRGRRVRIEQIDRRRHELDAACAAR